MREMVLETLLWPTRFYLPSAGRPYGVPTEFHLLRCPLQGFLSIKGEKNQSMSKEP